MNRLISAIVLLTSVASVAAAQFPSRVQSGVRVRVWVPEDLQQESGPWRRQQLRGIVSTVQDGALAITVPGTEGVLTIPRSSIRQLDVSLGRSRAASAVERAIGFAIGGAIGAALENDPSSSEWPHYKRDWRAAEEGAKWGAAIGAVVGFVFPYERWRRIGLSR